MTVYPGTYGPPTDPRDDAYPFDDDRPTRAEAERDRAIDLGKHRVTPDPWEKR